MKKVKVNEIKTNIKNIKILLEDIKILKIAILQLEDLDTCYKVEEIINGRIEEINTLLGE